ncbi:arsenate reductase family protein [Fictibacillus sp. 7GRE50]|uniref:arsenate reductase family protein n=1 Tax=unclassified Fictibacillus TaxID=2644029 RepID=UPI0018CFE676|nr:MULTISPECIES: arsenate reductase family protein [unclassified Fictibacillus]MBH0163779.1 arsenate reductase family protein [Fictibacillus sp. 7GRE50]MBH0174095.1 arsenate reductase family protein [Fictibacillus sp. 23RED33]
MLLKVYEYPKCSTCQKAKKWLKENDVAFEPIHIVESPPSAEELKKLIDLSGLEIKKFFNTSGMKYRELGMKEKMKTATEEELLEILASDGMLIKRPIATDGKQVTVGFKEDHYDNTWKK